MLGQQGTITLDHAINQIVTYLIACRLLLGHKWSNFCTSGQAREPVAAIVKLLCRQLLMYIRANESKSRREDVKKSTLLLKVGIFS